MKIECTKLELILLESIFLEKYASVSIVYQYPKFRLTVFGCDGI